MELDLKGKDQIQEEEWVIVKMKSEYHIGDGSITITKIYAPPKGLIAETILDRNDNEPFVGDLELTIEPLQAYGGWRGPENPDNDSGPANERPKHKKGSFGEKAIVIPYKCINMMGFVSPCVVIPY